MSDPITQQNLQDAATDAASFAAVVNGTTATTVTTRLGAIIPTLFGAIQQAIAGIMAAAGTITPNTPHVITTSATPNADLSQGFTQSLTLTGVNAVLSVSNPADGQEYSFVIKPGTSECRFPANFVGSLDLTAANGNIGAGTCSILKTKYDAGFNKFYVLSQITG